MRPSTLEHTLKALLLRGRNVMIESSPGLGKTQIAKRTVESLGPDWNLVFKHAPTMQPEDLALPGRGADGRLDFSLARWLPLERDYKPGQRVCIFIDELSQGDNSIQKSLANMMQERESYGERLAPGVAFVCTGNRASDRAGANRILSHVRNRMITLELEPSLDDWSAWALDNNVRPEIIQFARWRPNLLYDFDPQREINPTPRAWSEMVNDIVHDVEAGAISPEAEMETIKGAVGEGAAAEFCAFTAIYRKLPSPDAVIARPDTHPVPTETSVRYALSGALAHKASPENFAAIVQFLRRMPPEFGVMTVLDAIRRNPNVQNTPAFIDWASKDGVRAIL